MPKYNITAEFSLTTEVEADGVTFDLSEAEDVEDVSYFQSQSVENYGGEIRYTIEADTEDDALGEAERIFSDGQEVSDYNGLSWLVDGVSYQVEAVEEPMTRESAIDLVTEAIDASGLGSETQEALRFLLALIPRN